MAAHIISTHVPFANDVCMICTQHLSGVDLDRYPCKMECGHATLCLLCAHSLLRKKGAKCIQCEEWTAWKTRADICVNYNLKKKLNEFQTAVIADVIIVDQLPLSKLAVSLSPKVSTGTTPTAAAAETVVDNDNINDKYDKGGGGGGGIIYAKVSDEWAKDVFGEESGEEDVPDVSELEIEAREYYKLLYNSQYNTPLVELEKMINDKTINIQSGMKFDTEAIRCARKGSSYMMSLLLKYGADITKTDRDGNTALMAAAQHAKSHNLEVLINAGANVDFESKSGHTALMLAARNGHDACVELMIEAGANVEKRDQLGQTALMFACMNTHINCVKLLCGAGANLDGQSMNGDTALIISARWKSVKCLTTLVKAGANIDIRNLSISPHGSSEDGKTALDFICEGQDTQACNDCKQLLLERAAVLKKVSAKRSFWRMRSDTL